MPRVSPNEGHCFAGNNCTQEQVAEVLREEIHAARILRTMAGSSKRRNSILENGAGLGDVRVERFDDLAESLFDDAALDLESESKAAVVESEVLGEESEALDGFVLGEMRGKALDFRVDQGADEGMSDHLGV